MTALATTLQAFFTERLIRQRQASPHTLAAYRDTLRLLLVFASARKDVEPSKLDIDDLDAPLIGAFLDRCNSRLVGTSISVGRCNWVLRNTRRCRRRKADLARRR